MHIHMPIAKCLNCLSNCISEENNAAMMMIMHVHNAVYVYNVWYAEEKNKHLRRNGCTIVIICNIEEGTLVILSDFNYVIKFCVWWTLNLMV